MLDLENAIKQAVERIRRDRNEDDKIYIHVSDLAGEAIRQHARVLQETQELAKAKAEGRLVVLPRKIGDTVDTKYGRGEVVAWDTTARVKICNEPDFNRRYRDFDIGSKIFTREDAEKAIGDGQDV